MDIDSEYKPASCFFIYYFAQSKIYFRTVDLQTSP